MHLTTLIYVYLGVHVLFQNHMLDALNYYLSLHCVSFWDMILVKMDIAALI